MAILDRFCPFFTITCHDDKNFKNTDERLWKKSELISGQIHRQTDSQPVMSVSDTPKEDTESLDYVFRNYIILTLSYFFRNIFCKNKIINTTRLLLSIFTIFVSVYKFPSNQIGSDLKYCSKFEFYHAESVKLQNNLGIINRNTNLAFFAISKLRNKPAHFLKFYQILLILSGDIILNPGPCQTQLNDDKT